MYDNTKLLEAQKNVIESGIAAGNALLYGDKNGVIFNSCMGVSDAEKMTPVSDETYFHHYSMTKIFTVVSALILYEKGLLDLDGDVSRYLPAYADLTVYDNGMIRRAENRMTVRHLFTMTSGLTYLTDDFGGRVAEFERRFRAGAWDTVRFAEELASVPLAFEPGTQFRYGLSHDVLGALIEIISGQTLDRFFDEYIFRPLGMNDTYFYRKLPVEKEKLLAKNTAFIGGRYVNIPLPSRLVPCFENTGDNKVLSGGSGLVGTASDYARFLAALLSDGGGLIKPETLELMTRPALTPEQRKTYNKKEFDSSSFGDEHTFALGVRVQDKEAPSGSVGEYGWSGALGTWFFIDVRDGMWFLYMHQHTPARHGEYICLLRDAFYNGGIGI